ncbi:MAG: Crp/Fnr family transcriptional regulator, partial [bacterium]
IKGCSMKIGSNKPNFLRFVPIFSSLPPRDLEELGKIANFKTYKKNNLLFLKDDLGVHLFIVKRGSVKVIVEHEDGREIILSILYPGDIFGEMSLLDGKPRSATVVAKEDCEVLTITRNKFLSFLKEHPNVSIKILENLSLKLRRTDNQIKILTILSADERVAHFLLDLLEEYGVKRKDGILLDIKLIHQDIADMCGIRRETSNRVLSRFIKAGLIKREGKKIVITNRDGLYEKIKKELD